MPLNEVHARLGSTLALFMLALGLWAMATYLMKREVSPSFMGALLIGETLALVQATVGVFLWITAGSPGRTVHILYGVLSVILIPFVYFRTEGRTTRREALVFGLLCLFLFGVSLRAASTGGPGTGF
jgi:hypothetical protein